MTKSIAMITARGGSKRIPRKNIREFAGRPIIAWSIAAALGAGCFDEVMVSTDDEEIARVAERLGASVPFRRSAAASGDYATTAEVVSEVLEGYRALGREFDHACCVYPTAPFTTAQKLREGHELLLCTGADSVIPVVRFGYPIQRALMIDQGCLRMIRPEHVSTRSQDLEPAYHDAGQFYWVRVSSFLETRTFFAGRSVPIVVPESEVHDIDTEEDWRIAEMKYRIMQQARPD